MHFVVTGATGFVGHHLCAYLLAEGHEITGLLRPDVPEPIPAGIATVTAELTDPAAVGAVLAARHTDGVFHLAGAASVGGSFASPLATWRVNLDGTLSVLEAIRGATHPIRCVAVTSGEIYGRVPIESLPVDEHTPLHPLSPYGASKAAADLAAYQYRAGFGLEVIRVRAFNHVGPGQDARFVVPSVARQLAVAERDGLPAVELNLGNLSTRRDFTDVRDIVRAYALLMDRGNPDVPYLACTGRSVPISDLVEMLADISPLEVSITTDAELVRAGEQPDLYGSPRALTADTGWTAEISLRTTLSDTLEWWRGRVAEEA